MTCTSKGGCRVVGSGCINVAFLPAIRHQVSSLDHFAIALMHSKCRNLLRLSLHHSPLFPRVMLPWNSISYLVQFQHTHSSCIIALIAHHLMIHVLSNQWRKFRLCRGFGKGAIPNIRNKKNGKSNIRWLG